jgi:hypothetical protein
MLINESKKIGEALYDSKFYCNENYGWDHYAEYLDMYTFNLFGEPSLIFEGITYENQPPNPPTIDGPKNGKIGETLTYKISAIDPDGDDVYFWIEWFQGCPGVYWQGPYKSGEVIEYTNTWGTDGTFEITVKAKDTNDAESDTATLTVTIPRTKTILNLPFYDLFSRFTNLLPIVRLIVKGLR